MAACVLLIAACGSAAAAGPGGSVGRTPARGAAGPIIVRDGPPPCQLGPPTCAGPGSAAGAQVWLTVVMYPAGGGPHYVLTLSCEPDGGTAADPAAACTHLLADPGLLEPEPPGHVVMCPMILASSARAVVYGRYLGRQVNETIVDGGCDLQRWAELTQILQLPTSGSNLQRVNPGGPMVPRHG